MGKERLTSERLTQIREWWEKPLTKRLRPEDALPIVAVGDLLAHVDAQAAELARLEGIDDERAHVATENLRLIEKMAGMVAELAAARAALAHGMDAVNLIDLRANEFETEAMLLRRERAGLLVRLSNLFRDGFHARDNSVAYKVFKRGISAAIDLLAAEPDTLALANAFRAAQAGAVAPAVCNVTEDTIAGEELARRAAGARSSNMIAPAVEPRKLSVVWTCGVIPGHEHATKEEADACIQQHCAPAIDPKPPEVTNTAREVFGGALPRMTTTDRTTGEPEPTLEQLARGGSGGPGR